jgi:hypothetical protein
MTEARYRADDTCMLTAPRMPAAPTTKIAILWIFMDRNGLSWIKMCSSHEIGAYEHGQKAQMTAAVLGLFLCG